MHTALAGKKRRMGATATRNTINGLSAVDLAITDVADDGDRGNGGNDDEEIRSQIIVAID